MSEIKKIYWAHFFAGASNIASVTFTLYFLLNGLTQAQIAQAFALFMIALAIFEIPTGGIADTFGHKTSVVIGLFFQSLGFLSFFLFPSFNGVLGGMLASSLGLSFQSGAMSSLIYEILQKQNLTEDFQKVIGRTAAYFLAGTMIANPIGSFIFTMSPGVPYFLAFLLLLIGMMCMTLVKWDFTRMPSTMSRYFSVIGNGIHMTLRNRILMATVVIGIGLTLSRMLFNQNINQPYQVSVGVDIGYIGVLGSIAAGLQAIVFMYTHKITKRWGNKFSLVVLILVPSITLIILSSINTLLAIPFIMIFYMGHALREPIMTHITQSVLDPDKRSTMASTISFLVSVTVGIMLPFWGWGIDILGINNSLIYLGIFTLLLGVMGILIFSFKKSRNVAS